MNTFLLFQLILNFQITNKEKTKNLIFCQENHIFGTLLSKIWNMVGKKKKKMFLDMCLYMIFQ